MVLKASLEVRGPIVYATLIIVVAAVPIFFLDGLTGRFFRPLAISYTLAVLASMLVALTVTPALALIFLRQGQTQEQRAAAGPRAQARIPRGPVPDREPAPLRLCGVRRPGGLGPGGRRCWASRCCPTSRNGTS